MQVLLLSYTICLLLLVHHCGNYWCWRNMASSPDICLHILFHHVSHFGIVGHSSLQHEKKRQFFHDFLYSLDKGIYGSFFTNFEHILSDLLLFFPTKDQSGDCDQWMGSSVHFDFVVFFVYGRLAEHQSFV